MWLTIFLTVHTRGHPRKRYLHRHTCFTTASREPITSILFVSRSALWRGNPCLYGRYHFVGEMASYRTDMPSCISAVGLSSRYTVHIKGEGRREEGGYMRSGWGRREEGVVICGQGEGEGKKEWSYAVKVRAKGKVKSVTSLTLW